MGTKLALSHKIAFNIRITKRFQKKRTNVATFFDLLIPLPSITASFESTITSAS
jgi:hypothetical protein